MHADWIAEKQKTLCTKINIGDGAVIPFTGVDHMINIVAHTKRTTEISVQSSLHALCVQSMDYTDKPCNDDTRCIQIKTSRADPTTNFKRWMIEQARAALTPLAHKKATEIGKTVSKIDLRDPASRWGSCSTDGRLMFSWRIIMAPPYVLDYLVAHEVAHLKHMDHSQKFWDVCYALSERPEEARKWLKENGNTLMRYF